MARFCTIIIPASVLLLLLSPTCMHAQEGGSIHAEHADRELDAKRSPDFRPGRAGRSDTCSLSHIVFGWHPYWLATAHETHDFSLLSDVSYFSYEVNPTTGAYNTIHAWRTTPLVELAKRAGTRVNLCVTLFSSHATLFGNPDAVTTLIDSLVSLVKYREADGVNIDFEEVPASQKENLRAFMVRLSDRFHAEIPGSQVSIAIPAVDWRGAYDVAGMSGSVDLFIIMGYGYHWPGSSHAGPVAPRHSGDRWSPIDLTRSIDTYLQLGVPKQKLVLGLPWYGLSWPTSSDATAAPTTGRGTSRTYSAVRTSHDVDTSRWDSASQTPWIATQISDTSWQQIWFDDERSTRSKYELAVMKGIAGVAIWALGYDGGYPELWNGLYETFADCGETACVGELFDMGGPLGEYHPGDSWAWRVAPSGGTALEFTIGPYDIADDLLRFWAGDDTLSAASAELTGSGPARTIRIESPTAWIRFTSNGTMQGEGFLLDWRCSFEPLSVEIPRGPHRLDLK